MPGSSGADPATPIPLMTSGIQPPMSTVSHRALDRQALSRSFSAGARPTLRRPRQPRMTVGLTTPPDAGTSTRSGHREVGGSAGRSHLSSLGDMEKSPDSDEVAVHPQRTPAGFSGCAVGRPGRRRTAAQMPASRRPGGCCLSSRTWAWGRARTAAGPSGHPALRAERALIPVGWLAYASCSLRAIAEA